MAAILLGFQMVRTMASLGRFKNKYLEIYKFEGLAYKTT